MVNIPFVPCMYEFHGIVRGGRTFKRSSSPTCLRQAETSLTRSGCSELHWTRPWMFPGMRHLSEQQVPVFFHYHSKNFFLIYRLNGTSFSLKPLLILFCNRPCSTFCPYLSCRPLLSAGRCSKVFLEPSLLQSEQPQFSACLLRRGAPAPISSSWPPLDMLQQTPGFPVLRTSDLEAVKVGQSSWEGSFPLTWWPCFLWCSPGCGWLPGLQECTVCSCPVFHPPVLPNSLQGCSHILDPPACLGSRWLTICLEFGRISGLPSSQFHLLFSWISDSYRFGCNVD